MVLKQQFDFAYVMSCHPRVALEHISDKEAQGDRLDYTVVLRGEPKLPDLWYEKDGHFRPKDFIREIITGQPGFVNVLNGIVFSTLHQLEDALTVYGVLDGAKWDGRRLRAKILVRSETQTGTLLGPSDKRQGPEIHISSDQLRHTRPQSTPTRRPPSCMFGFQRRRPMRTQMIQVPGLSHGICPEEHVWNQLTSLPDKTCGGYLCPPAGGMSEPLGACRTFSTTSNHSPRRLSISSASSPSTSMYQSTPILFPSLIGDSQASRMTESCSSSPAMSSTRPYRPIIDGSLKGLE